MLQLQNLTKSFGSRVLFERLTYQFPMGEKIALFGGNGAGKTTLLNIICGLDHADSGEVLRPQDTRLGYLPQIPNLTPEPTILKECMSGAKMIHALSLVMSALEDRLGEGDEKVFTDYEEAISRFRLLGGYRIEAEAVRILQGLGFRETDLEKRPESLSGGWRMRLELAKIFLDKPDILILDEPTNHLDMPSLVWVEAFLKNYEGTVLLVSHDKKLLNAIPTCILHLSQGVLQFYKGNFDHFIEEREERMQDLIREKAHLARRREEMESFVARFGAKASKATQAQSRVKMIAKIRDLEAEIVVPDAEKRITIQIPEVKPTGRVSFTVRGGGIGYSHDRALLRDLDLVIEKGHKVAVIGANGVGKTTLIRTIAGDLSSLGGEFEPGYNCHRGYFAQNQAEKLAPDRTVLDTILQESDLGQLEARSLLGAFLFSGDAVGKKVSVLSGGERSRLGMAVLLAQRPNFLILDEPTNHLDMSSVEALIMALSEFKGTSLFVSHDRYFVDELCSHILVLYADGSYLLYEGKLDDYASYAAQRGLPNIFETQESKSRKPESSATPKVNQDFSEKKKQQREVEKTRKRLEKIEKDIEHASSMIAKLEDEMCKLNPTDIKALQDSERDRQTWVSKLATLEAEWLELSENEDH